MEALATPDELAAYLRQEGGAAALDTAAAELALASASGVVREYCQWDIKAVTETLTADGNGTYVVSLRTLYLTDVQAVRIMGRAGWELVDPAGRYTWSTGGQLVCVSGVWPVGVRNIQADVTHGYDEPPDALRMAVLALAARQYVNPQNLLSRTVGSVSEGYASKITDPLSDLQQVQLSRYRLP